MTPEKSLHSSPGISNPSRQAPELEQQKGIGGALKIRAITVPPGLLAARKQVDIDIFHLNHFKQACFAMSTAPAACAASPMGSFCDSEVADRIIDHNRAGAQPGRYRQSKSLVFCPDASAKRERRIIRALHPFLL